MTIPYTYTILSVDEAARCMLIEYTSSRGTMQASARLPYEGESLESIVASYAPLRWWEEQETPMVQVTVGTTGYIGPVNEMTLFEKAKADKLAEIAAWRYAKETGGITVNGTEIATDRESQAQLTSAYNCLRNNLLSKIESWKSKSGWVEITIYEVEAIAGLVAQHVQQCFNEERLYGERVNAANSIAEINAVVPGQALY